MHIEWRKVGDVNLIHIHAVQWHRSQLHKPLWFVCGPCQKSINILSHALTSLQAQMYKMEFVSGLQIQICFL